MPTNRRFRVRQRRDFVGERIALTGDLRHELLTGTHWHQGFGEDLDAMGRAWRQHRDELRPEFIASNPGKRPYAEWLFELVPEHGERRLTERGKTFCEGGPATPERCHHRLMRMEFLHTDCLPPLQELQAVYLSRHGLLEPGEWELWLETGEREEADDWLEMVTELRGKGSRANGVV